MIRRTAASKTQIFDLKSRPPPPKLHNFRSLLGGPVGPRPSRYKTTMDNSWRSKFTLLISTTIFPDTQKTGGRKS